MLDRAAERVNLMEVGAVATHQADVRDLELGAAQFDIIVTAAMLHHLREEEEWAQTFAKFYAALKPGGSIWISDLVEHSTAAVQALMWARYGDYLTGVKDEAYRDLVFSYIEQEDTPRPLMFQLEMLRQVGFSHVEILHKNSCFAAFGAIK
jgi:tRNA (cmo5U34)-methyltransferase